MKIVAIGGGEIGTTEDKPYNLSKIDEEIVKLTGKSHPTLLFMGFNERANFFFGTLKKNYMSLGAQCTYLQSTEFSNEKTLQSKFKRADIIFINGGNTLEYMKLIRKFNLDTYLKSAGERGAVLCGISAGAICLCSYGSSDARTYKDNENKYTLVRGTGICNIVFSPHFSSSARYDDMPRMTKSISQVAICADNCSALVVNGNEYKVVKSDAKAKIYKAFTKSGKYKIKEIEDTGSFDELIIKN